MFERAPNGQFKSRFVFYPDYYRSMAVRLYLYGAGPVTSNEDAWVISYAERTRTGGQRFHELLRHSALPPTKMRRRSSHGWDPGCTASWGSTRYEAVCLCLR